MNSLRHTAMLLTTVGLLNMFAGLSMAQELDLPSIVGEAEAGEPSVFEPTQDGVPTLGDTPPSLPTDNFVQSSPTLVGKAEATDEKTTIAIQYVVERPVTEEVRQGSKVVYVTRYVVETKTEQIALNANLDELDLPPDGKRAAVLAVTAARHEDLLKKLKEAETEEEKTEAADALKANYTEHYAIETWWREQRLAELEERLKEMRAQVQQREEAEEKYIDAAMTIAQLWADGIALEPPRPEGAPQSGSGTMTSQTYFSSPGPATVSDSPGWSPAPASQQLSPSLGTPSAAPSPRARTRGS